MGEKVLRPLTQGGYKGTGLAVLTSGGDSQGMNAAIRSVVRTGYYLGCTVYFIKEGYQGLITGGNNIVKASWGFVHDIIYKGGTIIGTARSAEYKEKSGRLKAVQNLIENDITNLVIIGGDGSLTGADLLKQEWPQLVKELAESHKITEQQWKSHQYLNIVGIVGSIDNDFCGTDMTIGSNSALHRITESIDAIISTAYSHRRTFIMEVMGRNCGYLALVAALTSEADFIFIPEYPVPDNWPEVLCNKLMEGRNNGQRINIIIVCEGALDKKGQKVTSQQVKKVVADRLLHDVRITVLGHLQRGGRPSAFDRILGSRLGADAVITLLEATETSESFVVCLDGNKIARLPLKACVEKCKNVTNAIRSKDFEQAVNLKGFTFKRTLEIYKNMVNLKPRRDLINFKYTLGIIHVGHPVAGMNATVRTFVRHCLDHGIKVCAIHDGLEGLINGDIEIMEWENVTGWKAEGGAFIGTSNMLPDEQYETIALNLRKHNIQGILFVGGFESYEAMLKLVERRSYYKEFNIPMILIPCAVSNNVPGTEFSLGCDTALNEIMAISDHVHTSFQGTNRKAYIFETTGGYCGYLATMASLAIGADVTYINEEKFNLQNLKNDVSLIAEKCMKESVRGVIVVNEKASENYNTEFIYRLFKEEGKNEFSVRMNQLGSMDEALGGPPSPFDRKLGTSMTIKALDWLEEMLEMYTQKDGTAFVDTDKSAVVLGLMGRQYKCTPIVELKTLTNFEKKTPNIKWWLKLRSLLNILAFHESNEEGTSNEPIKYIYENSEASTINIF